MASRITTYAILSPWVYHTLLFGYRAGINRIEERSYLEQSYSWERSASPRATAIAIPSQSEDPPRYLSVFSITILGNSAGMLDGDSGRELQLAVDVAATCTYSNLMFIYEC